MKKKSESAYTQKVVIETGVPLPDRHRGSAVGKVKSPVRLALETMDVGASFEVVRMSQGSIGSVTKKLRPKMFATRKIGEHNVRIWRTE